MLSLSRGLLIAVLSVGYVAWHDHARAAFADDEDEDDGGDEEGGDDKGGEEDDGEGEEEDKDQPSVYAGGLYTLATYPVRELDRPLTMTQQITQLRAGIGTDVSAGGAFETYGFNLEGRHGLKDNFTLLGGFTSAYNIKAFGLYAGFEASLAYDLIDFRTALRVSKAAVPEVDMMGIPTGKYASGPTSGGIDIGFPFRYVAKPEIAIVALDTLMSIDFNSKPDLRPSLGISTNPIPPVSVVIFAQLIIPDFNTNKDAFQIPATARIQFSPSGKLDIGGEFTFLNMKPPAGNFYDNRFLTLYMQARFGK